MISVMENDGEYITLSPWGWEIQPRMRRRKVKAVKHWSCCWMAVFVLDCPRRKFLLEERVVPDICFPLHNGAISCSLREFLTDAGTIRTLIFEVDRNKLLYHHKSLFKELFHILHNVFKYFFLQKRIHYLNFYFILFIFFIVVGFVMHWHESAMGLHVFPIPIPPPTSLSTRSLWVFPGHQARALYLNF